MFSLDITQLYTNLPQAYGSVLLAYAISKEGADKALPGCSVGDLLMDPDAYRTMLMGNNGAHAVGLFNVSLEVHVDSMVAKGASQKQVERSIFTLILQLTQIMTARMIRTLIGAKKTDAVAIEWLGQHCGVEGLGAVAGDLSFSVREVSELTFNCMIEQGVLTKAIEMHDGSQPPTAWTVVQVYFLLLSVLHHHRIIIHVITLRGKYVNAS